MDVGSYYSKIGFAGDVKPRLITRSVLESVAENCGDSVINYQSSKFPIRFGIIHSFEYWAMLIRCLAKRHLGVDIEGKNLMLVYPTLASRAQKEDMTKVAFEVLKVNGFYIA